MNENEIIEEWLPIEGYEGFYEVSNLGRVKSLIDNHGKPREKILKQNKDKYGYLYVIFSKKRNRKKISIHRLVASAFITNPNNLETVNHKDENKENNCVSNLEWCTVAYNNTFGSRIKKITEKLTNGVRSKQVYQYDKNRTLVAIYPSVAECGRNGFDQRHVSDCCLGKVKSHKGYIWSYIPL